MKKDQRAQDEWFSSQDGKNLIVNVIMIAKLDLNYVSVSGE